MSFFPVSRGRAACRTAPGLGARGQGFGNIGSEPDELASQYLRALEVAAIGEHIESLDAHSPLWPWPAILESCSRLWPTLVTSWAMVKFSIRRLCTLKPTMPHPRPLVAVDRASGSVKDICSSGAARRTGARFLNAAICSPSAAILCFSESGRGSGGEGDQRVSWCRKRRISRGLLIDRQRVDTPKQLILCNYYAGTPGGHSAETHHSSEAYAFDLFARHPVSPTVRDATMYNVYVL